MGSSLGDLRAFAEAVRDEIGAARSAAQFSGKLRAAMPWKGEGPGVFEIVDNHSGDAYRAIYTFRFADAV
jgi:phage-related protein